MADPTLLDLYIYNTFSYNKMKLVNIIEILYNNLQFNRNAGIDATYCISKVYLPADIMIARGQCAYR